MGRSPDAGASPLQSQTQRGPRGDGGYGRARQKYRSAFAAWEREDWLSAERDVLLAIEELRGETEPDSASARLSLYGDLAQLAHALWMTELGHFFADRVQSLYVSLVGAGIDVEPRFRQWTDAGSSPDLPPGGPLHRPQGGAARDATRGPSDGAPGERAAVGTSGEDREDGATGSAAGDEAARHSGRGDGGEPPAGPGSRAAAAEPLDAEQDAAHLASASAEERLVAALREATALMKRGQDDAAASVLERAIREGGSILPPQHSLLLDAQLLYFKLMLGLGRIAEGRELIEEVLAELMRQGYGDSPEARRVRAHLADAYEAEGDYARALEQREEVEASYSDADPESAAERLATGDSIVASKYALGDEAGAREREEGLLRERERTLPDGHPEKLAALLRLGELALARGDLAAARDDFRRALEPHLRSRAPGDPELVRGLAGLARALEGLGDFAEALALHEELVDMLTPLRPPHDSDLSNAREGLARALEALGDLDRARAQRESNLEDYLRALPPGHPRIPDARQDLAGVKDAQGDVEGALDDQQKAADELERNLPPDHPDLLAARLKIAELLAKLGAEQAAARARERALAGEGVDGGGGDAYHEMIRRASEYQQNCLLDEALELRRAILEESRRLRAVDDPRLLEASRELAALLRVLGRLDEARDLERSTRLAEARASAPVEAGDRDARAKAAARIAFAAQLYPPKVRLEASPVSREGTFELLATVHDHAGISRVQVHQDGVLLRSRPRAEEWTLDPTGTKGELRMLVELPAAKLTSLMTVTAESRKRIDGRETILVKRESR